MKLKWLCLLLILPAFLMAQQVNYVINGEVITSDTAVNRVSLAYYDGDELVQKKVNVVDGKFQFKGTIDMPVLASLEVKNDHTILPIGGERMIILGKEPLTVIASDVMDDPKYPNQKAYTVLGGGDLNKENNYLDTIFRRLNTGELAMFNDYMSSLPRNEQSEVNIQTDSTILAIYDKWETERYAIATQYVKQHPGSLALLNRFTDVINPYNLVGPDVNELQKIFSHFTPELRNSQVGQRYAAEIEKLRNTEVGKRAPNFTLPDPDGSEHSLNDLRGNYVLLDFWASWCVPCRAENPNLKKTYEALKDKGFTIVSVSLDDNRAAWLKAVKDDGLPWLQLSDVKGFETIAKLYMITSIPHNFLLNPDGVIIAKDLRGAGTTRLINTYLEQN